MSTKTPYLDLICEECGQPFKGYTRTTRYCSKPCRRAVELRARPGRELVLPTGTVGAISELVVGADLLRQGYEVFRALSPACSCDLLALKGGVMIRLEVRTGSRNPLTGKLYYARPAKDAGRSDHYAVVVGDVIVYAPALEGPVITSPESN